MIIAIAHNKGGVGKTTLALNLAATLKPDIIIDQDTHQNLVILNGLREQTMNIVICDDQHSLIKQLKKSELGQTILIDCGGFDSDINRVAIASADIIIVPANDDINELIGLRRFDQVLGELSEEINMHISAYVLFNRIHPQRKRFEEAEKFLSHAKHLTRLESVISRRKEYPLTAAKGYGVTECKATKYSDAARETQRLSDEISTLMAKLMAVNHAESDLITAKKPAAVIK